MCRWIPAMNAMKRIHHAVCYFYFKIKLKLIQFQNLRHDLKIKDAERQKLSDTNFISYFSFVDGLNIIDFLLSKKNEKKNKKKLKLISCKALHNILYKNYIFRFSFGFD